MCHIENQNLKCYQNMKLTLFLKRTKTKSITKWKIEINRFQTTF